MKPAPTTLDDYLERQPTAQVCGHIHPGYGSYRLGDTG
jgi:hypothetical protein